MTTTTRSSPAAASFGIDYVNPSTRWADIAAGPPAAASVAHVRKILRFAEARRDGARTAPVETLAAPALRRAA